jgi:hypothetical protein
MAALAARPIVAADRLADQRGRVGGSRSQLLYATRVSSPGGGSTDVAATRPFKNDKM